MNLDEAKALLEKSGKFKVLDKYQYQKVYASNKNNEKTLIGCVTDTETTELDPETAEVFNVGLVRFQFGVDTGTVFDIIEMYDGFQDTTKPLTQEIQDLTGITPDMIKGTKFDNDRINRMFAESDIIIAHHAQFDRSHIDRRWPICQTKKWFCTYSQIPWKSLGAKGNRLSDAAMLFNFCFEGHRALTDALATLHVLAQRIGEMSVMQLLLKVGSEEYTTVLAHGAPFTANGALRNGGYRWNKTDKVWTKRLPVSEQAREETYLQNFVYSGGSGYQFITIPRVDLFKS